MNDFFNITSPSFGKQHFTELCRSSKCWYVSSHNVKIFHSAISPLSSSEKSKRSRRVRGGRYLFSNILLFSRKLGFLSLAINPPSCYPWNDRLVSLIFQRTSGKHQGWEATVCLPLALSSKICSVRGAAGSATTQSCKCFSLEDHWAPEHSPMALCAFPISSARTFKRHVLKGWDFMTFCTFYCFCFIKDIHKWDRLFFFCTHMTLNTACPTALIFTKTLVALLMKFQPRGEILLLQK